MSTSEEKARGSRSIGHASDYVGKASAGKQLKDLHAKEGQGMSLRAFARKLANEGNTFASEWFTNKAGNLNQDRSDENKKLASLCGSATKLSKRSKKKGAGGSAKSDAKVVATTKGKTKGI